MENLLIQGNNLQGLDYLLKYKKLKGKIDLIYLDPPFGTGGNFTISKDKAATISNSKNGDLAYSDKICGNDFLYFLKKRLVIIKKLLSKEGSIYLHIDYKIGHYVKILMDEIFGIDNFRNDITRVKCNPKNFSRIGYGNIKDLILFYTNSSNPIWNEPRENYSEIDLKRLFPKKTKQGRRYTTVPIHAPGETKNVNSNKAFKGIMPPKGRHWGTNIETLNQWDKDGLIEWSSNGNPRKIIYSDEQKGKRVQDIWQYKDPQYPSYPTEKNSDLLDLIIRTSSNQNSIVMDCFCGSGTTLKSAQINKRNWIGIDQSDQAIQSTKNKIKNINIKKNKNNPCYEFIRLNEIIKTNNS